MRLVSIHTSRMPTSYTTGSGVTESIRAVLVVVEREQRDKEQSYDQLRAMVREATIVLRMQRLKTRYTVCLHPGWKEHRPILQRKCPIFAALLK